MKLLSVLISTVALILVVCLMISSLAVTSWSLINNKAKMSLGGCKDCDPLSTSWNFECFARSICSENSDLGLCGLYTTLYHSAYAFFVLEVASLLMALLLLEKIAILAVKGDFGSPWGVYATGGLVFVFHILATCLWLGMSGARWGSCSSTTDLYLTPSLCVLDGPKLAIANIFFITAFLGYFFYVFQKRTVLHQHQVIVLKKFLWLRGKYWGVIAMLLMCVGVFIILASLTTTSWVTQGELQGSLMRCHDCGDVNWMGWECLAGTECDTNSSSYNCGFYRKMATGSRGFVVLEAMTLISLILFSQSLTGLIRGRAYGIWFLNYAYPVMAVGFNLLATAVWFGTTQASFRGCELCGQDGPGLAVASQFFIIPMACIYVLLYYMRDEYFEELKVDTTMGDKVTDLGKGTMIFSESPKKCNSRDEEHKDNY